MTERRKRRRRAQRQRRVEKALKVTLVAVVVLAVIGVGAMLLSDTLSTKMLRRYPMEYTDLIRQSAAAENLEPAYVAAVILAESSYNPEAVSNVDAQGLMQILPSTAEWIAGKFDESYLPGSLFDPGTNLKYGCWYLGFLMERYNGDKRLSSAAYHAGQGTVDGWLKDPAYSADGKTLDVIAYGSTDTYVNRVLEYYEKYVELYDEQTTV